MSAILRVRDDEPNALVAEDEGLEVLRDGRQPAPAVDEDRDGSLHRELEDRAEALVVEGERLRSRMQLDPACADVESALRLLEGSLAEVEADERHEAALRALGVGEDAVVRDAEGRLAVVLVHAEDEGAREAVAVEHR